MSITHKTGFIFSFSHFQNSAGEWSEGVESWHRTFKGALKARNKAGERGHIYRVLGDDCTEEVAG